MFQRPELATMGEWTQDLALKTAIGQRPKREFLAVFGKLYVKPA